MTLNLRFTGHPIPDVGLATVCAMADRATPSALTTEDLDAIAAELDEDYLSGLMKSYLSCVFMNSAPVQPNPKLETINDYKQRILHAHRWAGDPAAAGLHCVFCRCSATHMVHRSQVPMLTGDGVLNFFPAGRGRLPLCGTCVLAVQALPMGGRRAEGKLLIVHSEEPELLLGFARLYLKDNRRILALARAGKLPAKDGPDPSLPREQGARDARTKKAKYADAKAPVSLVTSDLRDIALSRAAMFDSSRNSSLTIYLMSNSGQARAPETVPLMVYSIPSQLVRFLILVAQPPTGGPWNALVSRSWRSPYVRSDDASIEGNSEEPAPRRAGARSKKGDSKNTLTGGAGRSRNDLLEDLAAVFSSEFLDLAAAHTFLHKHLLPQLRSKAFRSLDDINAKLTKHSWPITELFLGEVLSMDPKQIVKVRDFADLLAQHIYETSDKELFRQLVFTRKRGEYSNALVKVQRNEATHGRRLLFGLDQYLQVFFADDAVGILDWYITCDLISIRLVEKLFELGHWTKPESDEWLAETPQGAPPTDAV